MTQIYGQKKREKVGGRERQPGARGRRGRRGERERKLIKRFSERERKKVFKKGKGMIGKWTEILRKNEERHSRQFFLERLSFARPADGNLT